MLNISDAYSDPRFNVEIDKQTGYRTRNIICIPIRNTEDQIIGIMVFLCLLNFEGVTEIINKRNGDFTSEDEELLKAFSIYCGMTLHNANLYESAIESQRRSQALLDVVMALSSDNSISRLIR